MAQTVLAPIDTPERAGDKIALPIAALTHLYPGTLIAENAFGFAIYATDTAGLKVMGRCESDYDNTADAVGGAISANVKRGVFKFFNSSTHPVAAATQIGTWLFVQDEQTVATQSTNSIKAGVFLGIDTDGKVWIDTRPALYS